MNVCTCAGCTHTCSTCHVDGPGAVAKHNQPLVRVVRP